jgi:hypothetical protein
LAANSLEQFVKWHTCNDIWALAMVQQSCEQVPGTHPPVIAEVLEEFADVLAAPTSLPPHREYDHTIPLLPNSALVNTRPYRYSPLHKDEIEKQVRTLLDTCLITNNTSLFASPVLLVQKKDGTWRFCVDYRKLNAITVKNKFPMPLVDEILDELQGSKFFSKLDFKSDFYQVRMDPSDEHKTAFKTTMDTINSR